MQAGAPTSRKSRRIGLRVTPSDDSVLRAASEHLHVSLADFVVQSALIRSLAAAATIGGRALVVNPIDQEPADFWHHIGFDKLRVDPSTLYLTFRDVAAIDPWS